MGKVSLLDMGIVVGYFILVTIIGFWTGRKKKKDANDYFVASGRLSWYLIGFGLLASSISTEQFVGQSGYAYKLGMPVLNWEFCNFVAMLIMLWIFLPIYLSKRLTTVPQYLELRFGAGPRNVFAVLSVLTQIFISLAGVI